MTTCNRLVEELNDRKARREIAWRSFLGFMKYMPPAKRYKYGRHTLAFTRLLQSVTTSMEQGQSRYVIILCPPRHGKSDMVARRFPIWHLGRHPDHEIILATYGGDLSKSMSRSARRAFASEEYFNAFGLRLSEESHSVADWEVQGRLGKLHAVGIEGAITGHGADLLAIDDYCKSRAQAESETVREAVWDAFSNDLMTRLAPIHGVIIGATRWHEDDLVGRIMQKSIEERDFPRFEVIRFPAWDEEQGGWLFPQRFPAEWYERQRAQLGAYAWQAMFQQDPKPRMGNMLRVDRCTYYDDDSVLPKGLRFVRFWDLASSTKERIKTNPDFTAGVKMALWYDEAENQHVFIDDMIKGQWKAPERDRIILSTSRRDGPTVEVALETIAGYKDAGEYMREILKGKRIVDTISPGTDMVIRASYLEPIFEAGNIHVRRADWTAGFISEAAAFPSGKKDDQMAALCGGYEIAREKMPHPSGIWGVMGAE